MSTIEVVEPATGQRVRDYEATSPGAVHLAVTEARKVFESGAWSALPPHRRQEVLWRLSELLEREAGVLEAREVQEAGKTVAQFGSGDHPMSVRVLRFFASAGSHLTGPAAGEYAEGTSSFLRRDPVGVVGAVLPWNYPLMMAAWKVGPVLAAGCSLLLKPAPQTPSTAQRLAELAEEAGVPEGVLQTLPGGDETGAALLGHPEVDVACLTGSPEAAAAVQASTAETRPRLHFELGGKAPMVIFPDAPADLLEDRLAAAMYPNQGESCTQAGRLIVTRSRVDEVIDLAIQEAGRAVVGDPVNPSTTVGPLITREHRQRVHDLVREGGATVLAGGAFVASRGWFYEPTVTIADDPFLPICQREVFGPVVTILPVADEEDALRVANSVPYDLSASVWTADVERALRMAKRLRAGCVWVNTHEQLAVEFPHGGYRRSGWGQDLSVGALEEYTVAKHVMVRVR